MGGEEFVKQRGSLDLLIKAENKQSLSLLNPRPFPEDLGFFPSSLDGSPVPTSTSKDPLSGSNSAERAWSQVSLVFLFCFVFFLFLEDSKTSSGAFLDAHPVTFPQELGQECGFPFNAEVWYLPWEG